MATLKTWYLAARPKTLWAGIAPVIVGAAMAIESGGFHAVSAVCALLGSMLIQIGANLANDYFDHAKGADTPDRIGPTRATQAGLVSPNAMLFATALTFFLACVPGLYIVWRGGWPFVFVGLASILCGILYTGGPWPLGYLGLGDLFVLIFFGPVAVVGTYYVQTLTFSWDAVLAGLATGCFSIAILTVNNTRDIGQDRAAGKKTLPVRFGRAFGRCEYLAMIILGSAAFPLWLAARNGKWLALLPLLVLPAALPTIRVVFTKEDGTALNGALASTGRLLLLFSVLFSIGWIL